MTKIEGAGGPTTGPGTNFMQLLNTQRLVTSMNCYGHVIYNILLLAGSQLIFT